MLLVPLLLCMSVGRLSDFRTFFRSLLGTFLPLAGPPLYAKLGLGWGNSVLGFIALALIPIPILLYR
jgi:hypothetical protein